MKKLVIQDVYNTCVRECSSCPQKQSVELNKNIQTDVSLIIHLLGGYKKFKNKRRNQPNYVEYNPL
ncbi:hypothetical protein CEH05_12385 [Halobacillus halophilus]|nr:hypothetical protein CEH05_12385 [Halobacillus halophilus]